MLDGEKLTVALAEPTSFDADGNKLTIAPGYFALSPRKQVKAVLVALAADCDPVAAVDEGKYVDLAKKIAGSQNRLR